MTESKIHHEARPSFVLLGASNLTLCRNHAVAICSKHAPAGARFFIADGLGRSYIESSRALARGLPSIEECRLWSALDAASEPETFALLTDVGNDLVYGRKPEEILGSLERCLDRLEKHGARCTLTGLPLDAIHSTSWIRFRLFKALLFPFRSLNRAALIEDAEALEAGLKRVAQQRGLGFAAPQPDWYGPDPIHFYGKNQVEAYEHYLKVLMGPLPEEPSPPPAEYRRAQRLPHADRTYFGRRQRYDQPSLRLEGGRFEISVY